MRDSEFRSQHHQSTREGSRQQGQKTTTNNEIVQIRVEVNKSSPPTAFARSSPLYGILDEINSDSYDLMSGGDEESKVDMNNAYEMFLGELVFSTNDPRVDIMNKIELASDPEFLEWLDGKVKKSNDPEERIAIQDLLDMIIDIKTRVEVSAMAEERTKKEAAEAERARIEANIPTRT